MISSLVPPMFVLESSLSASALTRFDRLFTIDQQRKKKAMNKVSRSQHDKELDAEQIPKEKINKVPLAS